jgi:hypothetical protein
MLYFNLQTSKFEEGTIVVLADRGWSRYRAIITFRDVLFSDFGGPLEWNISCRLATEEEASQQRSLHSLVEPATVYCFEDISAYYILGPVRYIKKASSGKSSKKTPFPAALWPFITKKEQDYFNSSPDALEVDPQFLKNALISLGSRQQAKTFVCAQSVEIVAFSIRGRMDNLEGKGQWREGDIHAVPEGWRQHILRLEVALIAEEEQKKGPQ